MTSSFAWLDFSDRDRKRALDAVDLFREEDTRDELGLGVICDAFADRFSQGRARFRRAPVISCSCRGSSAVKAGGARARAFRTARPAASGSASPKPDERRIARRDRLSSGRQRTAPTKQRVLAGAAAAGRAQVQRLGGGLRERAAAKRRSIAKRRWRGGDEFGRKPLGSAITPAARRVARYDGL